ncbi:MAG: type VI secretion system tube protein Hcp [Pseudomonadota bacterium]|nr:type VI secretion system tube protein Hcp [Pseudomonadota bacterium]
MESWSWSASNAGSTGSGGSGGGLGKADFSDITIAKRADKAMPMLLKTLALGQRIKSMVLICRKAGGASGQVEYLE